MVGGCFVADNVLALRVVKSRPHGNEHAQKARRVGKDGCCVGLTKAGEHEVRFVAV